MAVKRSVRTRIFQIAVLAVLVLTAGVLPAGAEAAAETSAQSSISYRYVQVSDIVSGEKYVIVDDENPVALMDNADGKMGKQAVSVSGNIITSDVRLTEWTFSGSETGTVWNGTHWLTSSVSSFSLSTADRNAKLKFTKNSAASTFKIQWYSATNQGRALYYDPTYRNNEGKWNTSSQDTPEYVRLCQYTETVIAEGAFGQTVDLDEPYTVTSGERLDLRGCCVNGTINVEEGGYVIDSATDGFDADAAGSVSGYSGPAVFSPPAGDGASGRHYAVVTVDGRTEFHRVAASVTAFRFDLFQGDVYLSVEGTFRGCVTDEGLCAGLAALTDMGFEICEAVGGTTACVSGSMFTDSGKPVSAIKPTKTVGETEVVAFPENEDRLTVHFTFGADLDAVYALCAKLTFGSDSALSTERTIDLCAALVSARDAFKALADDETADPEQRDAARSSVTVIERYLAA